VGSIFAFALDGAEPRASQGGPGRRMMSLAIVDALRDGKVAIEEVVARHAGIALKPLDGTSHHVNRRHNRSL
jgi:hypothetical protein